MYGTISYDVDRVGIARIRLARPQAGNAIDLAMARELAEATTELGEDPRVRVVLLTGEGTRFCVGGDLKSFSVLDPAELPLHLKTVAGHLHVAISLLASAPVPVVAAVQGAAAGAGLGLACCCDLVVAARSARFVFGYGAAGLTPDGSTSWILPRLIGLRRALDLALTNQTLPADEAREWGLVSRVVDDDDLPAEAEQLAAALAEGATRALGGAKRLLRDSLDTPLETQLEREAATLAATARTADAVEGIRSFLGKQTPRFSGR